MKHENLCRWLVSSLILVMLLGLCFIIPTSANEETMVSVSPQGQSVMQNEEFTVEIVVDPKVAIAGMQFDLSFDASLVTVNSVQEGNLLSQDGASTYFASGTIDNEAGTITGVAGAITTPGETVSSPGTFATITFTAGITGGTSPLDLSNVIVGDINGDPVSVKVTDGSVTIGWWLDISVPFYHKEHDHYSAAATCKMILDYVRGDAILSQDELYDYGHANNAPENAGIMEIDPQGVQATLNNYKPEQYNFGIIAKTSVNDLLRDVCYWMDYEVPDVAAPNTPAAVPVYGNYGNWMVVRGASASADPSEASSFTVYGLWLNDPTAEGIGENSYKTASELESTYLLPLSTGDSWDGKYVAVCEPPENPSEAEIEIADFRITNSGKKLAYMLGASEALPAFTNEDVNFSWQDVIDLSLLEDESFREALQGAAPSSPVRVKGTERSSDYYLIPFTKHVGGQDLTSVVLVLDAAQGCFKEASWVNEPVEYLLVGKQEAIDLALEKSNDNLEDINAELAWEPRISSSPYYPFWKVVLDNEAWFVTQERKVILGRLGNVNGDDKVNVLDIILIGQHWGETGPPGWVAADVKPDGIINVLDMIVVGQDWTG